MNSDEYDVCIFGSKCYSYLAGVEDDKYLGGIERDLVALANVLTERYRVAFATFGENGATPLTTDSGIDVFPVFDPASGIRRLRFLHPRLTSVVSLVKKLRPKLVIQEGAGEETFLAWSASRAVGARFCFMLAHDGDCMKAVPEHSNKIERMLYLAAVKRSDRVWAQTTVQDELTKRELGLTTSLVKIPSLDLGFHRRPDNEGHHKALWVGRIVDDKRPAWINDIAERMPAIEFHVVGGANVDNPMEREFVNRAQTLPNVILHGRKHIDELLTLYQDASLLLSTSIIEGFPRVYLEAWSTGLPAYTSYDPDGVVKKYGLGVVYEDVDELEQALRDLNYSQLTALADVCREFYDGNYTKDACRDVIFTEVGSLLER